jgi:hypothetical protein
LKPGTYTSETGYEMDGAHTIYYKNDKQLPYSSPLPPVLYTKIESGGAKRRTKRRRTKRRTKKPKIQKKILQKI